jgi:hypothetical protein
MPPTSLNRPTGEFALNRPRLHCAVHRDGMHNAAPPGNACDENNYLFLEADMRCS